MYETVHAGYLKLIICDIQGREVVRLIDGELSAGYHQVMWDASDAASGIYFYRLEVMGRRSASPTFVRTRKMVLLR